MIIYSIFDTTAMAQYKHLESSNNIEDVYKTVKSFLQMDIDYTEFVSKYHMKVSGQYVYESDVNFKSLLVLITFKE